MKWIVMLLPLPEKFSISVSVAQGIRRLNAPILQQQAWLTARLCLTGSN